MNYLYYGNQEVIVRNEIRRLIKLLYEKDERKELVYRFSLKQNTLDELVSLATSYSFFDKTKLIIVEDCENLFNVKENDDIKKISCLVYNVSLPSNLLFVIFNEKINKYNIIYKTIKDEGEIHYVESLDTYGQKNYVKGYLLNRDAKIDNDALDELIVRCDNDMNKLLSEAQKLSIYHKKITLQDVKSLVKMPLETNVFNLFNSLLDNHISQGLQIFRDLIISKEDPVRLVSILSTQIRFLMMISYLNKQNYTLNQIVERLNVTPYRVKINLKYCEIYSYDYFLRLQEALFDLDFKIKSGSIDPIYGFEMFICNFSLIKKA